MEIKIEIEVKPVYLCCMDEQIPTVLIWEGRRYILEEIYEDPIKKEMVTVEEVVPAEVEKKETGKKEEGPKNHPVTENLQKLVNERNAEDLQVAKKRKGRQSANIERLGPVVARSSSGNLINRKPLDEMLALQERGKLTSEAIEEILARYHPDVKKVTLTCYKSGYKTYIENPDEGDVRSNTPPEKYETVTSKDVEKVKNVIWGLGKRTTFEEILKHLDMTEYKLKLILKEHLLFEKYEDDGKEKYKLK